MNQELQWEEESKLYNEFVKYITYKPDFSFEVPITRSRPTIWIYMLVDNSRNPDEVIEISKGAVIPDKLYEQPVKVFLDWVRTLLADMEDHELDEWFCYRGERVKDPHDLANYDESEREIRAED